MSSLPPIQPSPSINSHLHLQPLALPFRPVATKAEKYAALVNFDQRKLKRHKAHFRNALKTTEGLERVATKLERRLETITDFQEGKLSFDRLSAFRDAFEDIIEQNHQYSPELNRIKESYNEYILFVLSQQDSAGHNHIPGPPINTMGARCSQRGQDIGRLKKLVHQLEVESRVLLHENTRLREELQEATVFHENELTKLNRESEDALDLEMKRSSIQQLPRDYASRVEDLQLKIAQKQDSIEETIRGRQGCIPLSVCHNLEQCSREVEIEIQKCRRNNKQLRKDIKNGKEEFITALKDQNLQLSSDLGRVLGFS